MSWFLFPNYSKINYRKSYNKKNKQRTIIVGFAKQNDNFN